jgi:guanosine-3',5'-bis(diphosphate) 3'-pyrophosphohydrolase
VQYFDRFKSWPQARRQLTVRLPASTLAALDDAAEFAIACHGNQMRPSIEPVPYEEHLVETLDVLVNGAGVTDRDVLVAALLHDVVEDTPCTEGDVRTAVRDRVSNVQHLENFAHVDKRGRYYRETVEHILPLADRHEWFRDWFAAWREEKKDLAAAP